MSAAATRRQKPGPSMPETPPATAAQRAAELVNLLEDRDDYRVFFDALDEPVREELLTWFAEWDREFCEALNPTSV